MLTVTAKTKGRSFEATYGKVKFTGSAQQDEATSKVVSYDAQIQFNTGTEAKPVFESVASTRMSGGSASTNFNPSKADYAGEVYAVIAQFLLDVNASFNA